MTNFDRISFKTHGFRVRDVAARDEYGSNYFLRIAQGTQLRVAHSEEIIGFHQVPDRPFDWVKFALVSWQPSLDFGWLKPKMKQIPIKRRVEETYYNVYPLSESEADLSSRSGDTYFLQEFVPNRVDWLEGEPFTRKEVNEATHTLHRWNAEMLSFFGIRGINPEFPAMYLIRRK